MAVSLLCSAFCRFMLRPLSTGCKREPEPSVHQTNDGFWGKRSERATSWTRSAVALRADVLRVKRTGQFLVARAPDDRAAVVEDDQLLLPDREAQHVGAALHRP